MQIKPYRQGHLDGLCGVYSVINSTRLVMNNISEDEAAILLEKIFKYLEKRKKKISNIIVGGIYLCEVQAILRDIIRVKYPITISRPFYQKSAMTIDKFWEETMAFMRQDRRRSIIVSFDDGVDGHWTVLCRITEHQAYLFDSSGIGIVRRKLSTIMKATSKKPYAFNPKETFFLSRNTQPELKEGERHMKKKTKKRNCKPPSKTLDKG